MVDGIEFFGENDCVQEDTCGESPFGSIHRDSRKVDL